jgi:hypothetical protein
MGLIQARLVGNELRQCPADAEIEKAEVSDNDPCQRKDAETIHTQSAHQYGNSKHGDDHRQERAQQIPDGVAGQEPPAGKISALICHALDNAENRPCKGRVGAPLLAFQYNRTSNSPDFALGDPASFTASKCHRNLFSKTA